VEVLLLNQPSELSRLHAIVAAFARENQITEKALAAMELALEEHVTNIIHYAYPDKDPHWIRVWLHSAPPWLEALVEDDGKAFDPLTHPAVDTTIALEHKPVGGLGIHMMRRSTDEMTYRREAGKNVLTLRKRVS
jgi:anti-sigma regulatory factor (Ser/Thr protein kinase)